MRAKRMLSVILLIAFAFQIAAAQQGELASNRPTRISRFSSASTGR
jgi:hypothetical protein